MPKLRKRKKTVNMLDMSSRSKISFTKDMPEKTWTIDDQSKYLQKKMTNYDGYIKNYLLPMLTTLTVISKYRVMHNPTILLQNMNI